MVGIPYVMLKGVTIWKDIKPLTTWSYRIGIIKQSLGILYDSLHAHVITMLEYMTVYLTMPSEQWVKCIVMHSIIANTQLL